jgi:hypothetical protein
MMIELRENMHQPVILNHHVSDECWKVLICELILAIDSPMLHPTHPMYLLIIAHLEMVSLFVAKMKKRAHRKFVLPNVVTMPYTTHERVRLNNNDEMSSREGEVMQRGLHVVLTGHEHVERIVSLVRGHQFDWDHNEVYDSALVENYFSMEWISL